MPNQHQGWKYLLTQSSKISITLIKNLPPLIGFLVYLGHAFLAFKINLKNTTNHFGLSSRLRHFGPVFVENVDRDVGERMVVEQIEHVVGDGANIRTGERGFQNVLRMTRGGGQNLRFETVIVIN